MRLTRFRVFLLCGGAMLLVGPAIGLGQFQGPPGFQPGAQPGAMPGFQPGASPGGFQFRQRGQNPGQGRQFDPNMIFNMLSGGKDYIDVATYLPLAQMRDPSAADKVHDFMQRMGITNGQLTRDQFSQFMQERMAQRQAQRAADPNNGQNPGDPNAPGASPDAPVTDDGVPIPEDKRPTVYRAGNLPTDILSWFASMDTDRDGQVGLYEWKAGGRSVSDFQPLDLNGDGFITIEEAERYQRKMNPTLVASAAPSFPGAPGFNGQQFNGFNRNGFNPNGFNQNQNGFNQNQFGNRGNRGNRGTRGNRGQNPYGN